MQLTKLTDMRGMREQVYWFRVRITQFQVQELGVTSFLAAPSEAVLLTDHLVLTKIGLPMAGNFFRAEIMLPIAAR